VEQSAAAAESLRVQAQELVQAVAVFKLNQDAAERAAPAHAKAADHRGPNQATSVMRTQSGTRAAQAGLKVSAAASPAQDAQALTA
jgi:methyl-accepting chemotaxis protein